MASSFLIYTPDAPAISLVVASSLAFHEDYPLVSSFSGRTYLHSRSKQSASTLTLSFDLGSGISRQADHLILGGVSSLLAAGVDSVKLQASSDNSVWIDQLGTTSSLASKIKDGPYSDDIIFTSAKNNDLVGALAPYRYFRVVFAKVASPSAILYAFRKLYFGAAFDIGEEPSAYNLELIADQDQDTWQYPRGHVIMSKAFRPKHRVTVEWDGVSDAKANEFAQKLLGDSYRNTVYLYTQTYKDPLYDNVLLHCRVVPESTQIVKANDVENWNNITAVFEET
jgi:hypothetical protein